MAIDSKARRGLLGGVTVLACVAAGAYGIGRARADGIPANDPLYYAGTLDDGTGNPLTGTHGLQIVIWDDPTSTASVNQRCTTVAASTVLTQGRFRVPLDNSCTAVVHATPDLWVDLQLDGTSLGRVKIGAAPFAVEAERAAGLTPAAAGALVPTGTVVAFAGTTIPTGWLLCDGSALSRSTYAALFAAIGTLHGSGDGTTTFNLPDYRGRFIRGTDNGAGHDPDAVSRTAAQAGGSTGDAVGSVQGDAFRNHDHTLHDPGHYHPQVVSANPGDCPGSGIIRDDYNSDVTNACAYPQGANTGAVGTGITIDANGGSETRSLNAGANFIVKY